MTDARDIVERDHIKETTETLFRIAINATMPKENEAKWCQALQYAGAMLEKQQADLASLRKQLEDARSLPTDDGVTDEMVERAAKAICHDAGNPPTYWDEPATAGWVDYKDGVKRMYRNYARAALQAALGPLPAPPAC